MNAAARAASLRQRRDAGFTLMELLVVLAIVAAAFAALRALPTRKALGIEAVGAQLAVSLRSARETAVATSHPVALLIGPEGTGYQYSTARAGVALPRGVRLAYHGVPGFNRAGLGDRLSFFADGTSTGGHLVLADGRGAVTLRVEPLSGSVRVETAR